MFCVLDGLDECDDSTLRGLLPRLVCLLTDGAPSSTNGAFRLAILSRDLLGLRGCRMRVRLDPDNDEKVASDIELFVSARVQELSRTEGFDDFQVSVQTTLLQRAEGTFLWVGFAIDELSQKQTCTEILEALEDLPSGLPAIYSRMLRRIPAKHREVSLEILRWVTTAARPLQLRELAAAVGIQGSPRIPVERAVRDAIALCGPLLKIQEQEISLIHQSFRDYLLRTERDKDRLLETFRLNTKSSHLKLARKCLEYIAQSDLQYRVIDLDAKLDSQVFPLLRYATLYWPEHTKSCSILAVKLFDPFGIFFKKQCSLRDHWWKVYHKKMGVYIANTPLLHMACILEIIPWVEAIIGEKSWRPADCKHVNEKDKYGETALHWATEKGNEAVVRLLVDRGADVNAKDDFGHTVLQSASSSLRKTEAVVQLLMDRGADVKAIDDDGETALHWATFYEKKGVVQLLLDRGADIKAINNNRKTALHLAAWRGNEAVVRLLVERGADIKATDNFGNTVLQSAALLSSGNEAVVRFLVDREADIKAEDNKDRTVL